MKATQARSSLREFIKASFPIVDPGARYLHNWHIDLISDYLEGCRSGAIRRLIINIPPRFLKSICTSVAFPAFLMGHNPAARVMCASYAQKLSLDLSAQCRLVMQSDMYKAAFPKTILSEEHSEKSYFETTARGFRIATSTGAAGLGLGGDFLIADDIHNAMDAQSDQIRGEQLKWFDRQFTSRLNDKKRGCIIVIMQRLHQEDLTGHLLEQGGWKHLKIPVEAKTTVVYKTPTFEHTFKRGEYLHPDRMGRREVEQEQRAQGSYSYSGQFMQDPVPDGGGIFKRGWFKTWTGDLPRMVYVVQSYDTAFTEKTEGDPTACTVWGVFNRAKEERAPADYAVVLLDAWDDHLSFPDLKRRVMEDYKDTYGVNDKRVNLLLIEEKGSGKSLVQELNLVGLPVRGYNPGRADKVARAHVVSPIVESGRVYIPEGAVYADAFLRQVCAFPAAKHDDYVDTMTQALALLEHQEFLAFKEVKPHDPDDVYWTPEIPEEAAYG